MNEAKQRSFYWTLILIIVVICVVFPYFRYQGNVRKIDERVKKGVTKEGEEKASFIKLGLDLAGGVDLLYQAVPAQGSKNQTVTKQEMAGLIETIRRRVDPEGVKEVSVQEIGIDRLNIQIPGETDPERTKKLIGKTALLQFIDAGDTPWKEGDIINVLAEGEEPPKANEAASDETGTPSDQNTQDQASANPDEEKKPDESANPDEATKTDETGKDEEQPHETYYVKPEKVILIGRMLKSAVLNVGQYGGYEVDFELNREGGRIFGLHTQRNQGKFLAIVLDGQVISCPVIKSAIPHGRGVISGNFSAQEAQDLATLLQSGALPIPLKILSSRAIGPSLGQDSINFSLKAGILGLMFVVVFMVAYYRFVGFMADLALMYYSFIFLGMISAMGITLTLPGIAGFILSLGMAVDANVIIFERIREELNSGKTYKASVEAGFERALPAILDSNVTTLIAGIVLYMMGSGTIKGFAITLNLGILISMFSALVVTKNLIGLWSGIQSMQRPGLYGWNVHPPKNV